MPKNHIARPIHTTTPVDCAGTYVAGDRQISSIGLHRKNPVGWFVGFAISFFRSS